MTIIEIGPYRNGWQVYEGPGVQPVFLSQEQAIRESTRVASSFAARIADKCVRVGPHDRIGKASEQWTKIFVAAMDRLSEQLGL